MTAADLIRCPECTAGKHGNCDGTAWDTVEDCPTKCECPCGTAIDRVTGRPATIYTPPEDVIPPRRALTSEQVAHGACVPAAAYEEAGARVRKLEDEVATLQRWKDEALPVLDGLQEVGHALGVPLGTRITGRATVDAALDLRNQRDAAVAGRDRLQLEVDRLGRMAYEVIDTVGLPSKARIWRDGVLIFDGVGRDAATAPSVQRRQDGGL